MSETIPPIPPNCEFFVNGEFDYTFNPQYGGIRKVIACVAEVYWRKELESAGKAMNECKLSVEFEPMKSRLFTAKKAIDAWRTYGSLDK